MTTLRIGTRDSALALAQARMVERAIRDYGGIGTELVPIKTTGDLQLDKTLDEIGGKGVFVKELDQALLDKRVDICVHSLKDLELQEPEGICLYAVGPREDPRDVILFPQGRDAPLPDKPVGSSSQRRKLQMCKLYPGCWVEPVRGNVATRLQKLDRGDYGALVLAVAGLKRLGLESRVGIYLSPEQMIPACGQGIVAVTARTGEALPCLAAFHDPVTWDIAQCERAFLATVGGGCSSAATAHARIVDGKLVLAGYAVTEGGVMVPGSHTDLRKHAVKLGVNLGAHLKQEAEKLER